MAFPISFKSYQFSPNLPAPINEGSTAQSKVGYLAIGTSTEPNFPLDVVGTIQVTGLKMTTGAGADKVLTTDASGVATWQEAAGGGLWTQTGNDIYYNDGNVGIGTAGPAEKLTVSLDDSVTSAIATLFGLNKTTTGTAGAGIGSALMFRAEADDGALIDLTKIASVFGNASSTAPQTDLRFYTRNEGDLIERMRITKEGDIAATGLTDAAFNSIFLDDRWVEIIDLKSSLDGFTTSIGSLGIAEPYGMYFRFGFGSNGTYARIKSKGGIESQNMAGRTTIFEFLLLKTTNPSDQDTFICFTNDSTQPPSETAKHVGFKFVAGDIYATSADGTTQTQTDTGVNLGNPTINARLRIEWTWRTDIRFYVNGVLRATHDTPTPIGRFYELYILSMNVERNALPGYYYSHWGKILIHQSPIITTPTMD